MNYRAFLAASISIFVSLGSTVSAFAQAAPADPSAPATAPPTDPNAPTPAPPVDPNAPVVPETGPVSLEDFQALQKQVYDLKNKSNAATAGYGKLAIGGLAQVWIGAFTHPETQYFKLNGFAARLRRLEVKLDGTIDPRLQWHSVVDFTRAASTQPGTIGLLQDLYLQYSLGAGQDLLIGQLKLPLSELGLFSSAHLPTIERPLFMVGARNTKLAGVTAFNVPLWGDIRETGVQYKRTDTYYTLQGAITQGAGDYQNQVDNKYGKQFTGQLFFRPMGTPNLQVGITGSGGAGFLVQLPRPAAPAGGGAQPPQSGAVRLQRIRGGGSVIWKPGRWYVESEYMGGTDGVGVTTATNGVVNIARHGEYGVVGYDLGGYAAGEGYQVVAMHDYWDPGAGIPRQTNTTLGLNHDLAGGHRRLQLNLVHQHYDGGTPAPTDRDIDGVVAAFAVNW